MERDARHHPIITGIIIAMCAYFYGALFREGQLSRDVWANYGVYLDAARVWEGRYWTLLSSAFMHEHIMHLVFSLVCLWAMAGRLEQVYGHQTTFALVFFGAIITSGAEFAMTGATGTGLSGVVFTLFGFMWATREIVPELRRFMNSQVLPLLTSWLLIAVLISWLGLWPTGNAAHLAGLMFGVAVGYGFFHKKPVLKLAGFGTLAALAAVVVLGLTCAFWSADWANWRQTRAHKPAATVQAAITTPAPDQHAN